LTFRKLARAQHNKVVDVLEQYFKGAYKTSSGVARLKLGNFQHVRIPRTFLPMDATNQMINEQSHKVHLSPDDQERLRELRSQKPARNAPKLALTPGAMLADRVAETVGSWRFIIIQSVLLGIWIILNMLAFINHWDPYPFILLNLVLSFQAAYAAPIIMMSQNRQSEIDRRHAEHDYRINVKAELEIELLHNKIDALREQEILQLLNIIQRLSAHLAPELVAAIEAEAVPHKI
jgi:uncharacterized membrane protein